MLKDIVEVRPLGGHQLYLRFEDGVAGEIDVADLISFDGIFAPLRDERRFDRSPTRNCEAGPRRSAGLPSNLPAWRVVRPPVLAAERACDETPRDSGT